MERLTGWIAASPGTVLFLAVAIVLVYVFALVVVLSRNRKRMAAREPTLHEPDHSSRVAASAQPQGPAVPFWASARGRSIVIAGAAVLTLTLWIAGALLSPDLKRFLASREWHAQPLYLFVHALTVRFFASVLSRNYLIGAAHLQRAEAETRDEVRHLLSVVMPIGALLIAVPFIWMDYVYFISDRHPKLTGTSQPAGADWIMFGIWSVEWLLNAMVWLLLVGFLWLNVRALRQHPFRAPIHAVLAGRHYRPFLRMSAQGATMVFAFSLVTAAYILYAGGALTDYLGLIITVGLLPLCFVPPWIVVRQKVNRLVEQEMGALQGVLNANPAQAVRDDADGTGAAQRELIDAVAILRLMHLERLHDAVGRREATAVALRIVAPAATIGWQLWQNGAQLLERVMSVLRAAV